MFKIVRHFVSPLKLYCPSSSECSSRSIFNQSYEGSGLVKNINDKVTLNPINLRQQTVHFSTTPARLYATKKRRKRHPFFWLQDQYHSYYDENLTRKNEEYFQKFLREKYSLDKNSSPLKTEPWSTNESYKEGSARTGLIARKLGVTSMWTKKGEKLTATCLQVSDNHVIKYHSPEQYANIGRPLDRERYKGLGCIVVGADSRDPRVFTAEYNGLFEESGVMPKQKLTRFFITHDSRIEPGTPLMASHFRPGMWVDVYGKSREYGYVGLRRQFQLKLGQKGHGCTKAHNRIGSIGRGRKWCGPLKGKKMQGASFGGERVIVPGLLVLKVNTKYNLIYVHNGCIPGGLGDYVNIMDSRMPKKQLSLENPPPFPTVSLEQNNELPEDLIHSNIHLPSEPSITFEVTEEEKRAAMLALRGVARTAQKIR